MKKEVLVILPGWGGSHETWQDFIKLASDKFEIVCIDLPCFGTEPCPNSVWGVQEYTKFVYQKISQLPPPINLLGHSFGGQVATYFTANNQQMISKLILIGAAVLRPTDNWRRLFFGTIAKLGKIIFRIPIIEKYNLYAKKILYRMANSPDYSNTAGIKRDIFKKIIREDLGNLLPKIKTPTLVIWGKKDTYVPLKHGKIISQTLPHGRLAIMDGKHGLHLTNPMLVDKINAFVYNE